MAKRFPHYLGRNHANHLPANCIWFDTETKPILDKQGKQHHYLWFGYAVYQRRKSELAWEPVQWLRFDTIDAFWDWVISKTRPKTRLYLFSHNGAFDLPVMSAFTMLPKLGFTLKSAVADAPPLILTWKKDTRTIKFIDTLNIWRMPLQAIGKSIGVNKLPMPSTTDTQASWDEYGKQDAEIIRVVCLAWFEFIRQNDLGGFSPTLASQAFNAYRHRFMQQPIFIDANDKAIEISRNAYVGGRVECFRIGSYSGQFYYIDVNSMYPSVMQSGKFPHKLIGVYNRPTKSEMTEWVDNWGMIVECDIETNEPIYPLIKDNKLVFPVGEFRVTLAKPEFIYAHDAGHVKKVHRIALYEQADLFSTFITTLYDLRLAAKREGNNVNSWLYKILMNSLYGKFGQRGRIYKEIDTCDPELVNVWDEIDADTGKNYHWRQFGGIVQELQTDGESRESFPAIAATVTSYARLKLWRAICQAGIENCYYCDTDSMVINEQGYDRMKDDLDSDRLGSWKLERTLKKITLHGAKDYIFDDVKKVKGVRHSAIWLSPNRVVQDQFVGLKGLLRLGQLSAPIVFSAQKHLSRLYSKGVVNSSGLVSPFRLSLD